MPVTFGATEERKTRINSGGGVFSAAGKQARSWAARSEKKKSCETAKFRSVAPPKTEREFLTSQISVGEEKKRKRRRQVLSVLI